MQSYPVLYSYRRCPYAMRARMGIYLAGVQVEQREIVFWDKPPLMLAASPKATVPVLILPDGHVIDESLDILFWAVNQSEQACSDLIPQDEALLERMKAWVERNDNEFKDWLDKYKYADRFLEQSQSDYRQHGELFLKSIEVSLTEHIFLLGNSLSLADIALFPFVRQFVNVDKVWFEQADYPYLKNWLAGLLKSHAFKAVMKNRPVWQAGHYPLWVDEPDLQTRNEFTAKAIANTMVEQ